MGVFFRCSTAVLVLMVLVAATASGQQPRPSRAGSAAARPDMLAIQVLLDRAGFSPGEIDGLGGTNTQRAIEAFEREKGGSITDLVAAATASPTLRYTVTAEDVGASIVN